MQSQKITHFDPEAFLSQSGVGRRMVEWLMAEARAYALDAVFAFTYVPEFFHKMGFEVTERGILPLKAWKDCLRCPKFQCCDEIAMVKGELPEKHLEQHGVLNIPIPLVRLER